MEKRNKIFVVLLVIATVLIVGFCIYSVINKEDVEMTDAIKFKNEYSELNGKVNEANGKNYVNVSIKDDNTVKYVSEEEAVKLLETGSGIIYFGFSKCPWCRSLVTTLTETAKELNETIYYLDVLNIRSAFSLTDGKLEKIKNGSDSYYDILKLLDNQLEPYYLTDEAGNQFDTLEKRLYAPTLVAVKDGVVTGIHVGTVDSQVSGYDELNSDQVSEIKKKIKTLIDSKNFEVCTDEKC